MRCPFLQLYFWGEAILYQRNAHNSAASGRADARQVKRRSRQLNQLLELRNRCGMSSPYPAMAESPSKQSFKDLVSTTKASKKAAKSPILENRLIPWYIIDPTGQVIREQRRFRRSQRNLDRTTGKTPAAKKGNPVVRWIKDLEVGRLLRLLRTALAGLLLAKMLLAAARLSRSHGSRPRCFHTGTWLPPSRSSSRRLLRPSR